MRTLYPPSEPVRVHSLAVDDLHRVYVEECGNPAGIPVVFLHGGPGSGCRPHHRQFFDLSRYRAILFDQRGCGRSAPVGALRDNDTSHLIDDLEQIRRYLGINQWLLFGGSWGATLALAYAQAYPAQVRGLILRGTFLAREEDLAWFLGEGANRIYPEAWARFTTALPAADRARVIELLYRRLTTETDRVLVEQAALAWLEWGGLVTLGGAGEPADPPRPLSAEELAKAKIEAHYAAHRYFLDENQLLRHCDRIAHLPAIVIHGRCDLVCPPVAGWQLHQRLPRSEWICLADAGHVAYGAPMIDALVCAADRFANGELEPM